MSTKCLSKPYMIIKSQSKTINQQKTKFDTAFAFKIGFREKCRFRSNLAQLMQPYYLQVHDILAKQKCFLPLQRPFWTCCQVMIDGDFRATLGHSQLSLKKQLVLQLCWGKAFFTILMKMIPLLGQSLQKQNLQLGKRMRTVCIQLLEKTIVQKVLGQLAKAMDKHDNIVFIIIKGAKTT